MRIRRARRADYGALAALGKWPGVGESERRSIRLFRRVVADLGCDPYVIEDDSGVVGFVNVHYARVLALGGASACVEELVTAPGVSPASLLEHARRRAGQRGARRLRLPAGLVDDALLIEAGFGREDGGWVLGLEAT